MNNIIKRKKEICTKLAEIAERGGDKVYVKKTGKLMPSFGGILTASEDWEMCPHIHVDKNTFDEAYDWYFINFSEVFSDFEAFRELI